jgi:hypothetical protein
LASGDDFEAKVEISDAAGHTVYLGEAQMDGQTPLNTSSFAPGFYNVHVTGKTSNQNFKWLCCMNKF